MHHKNNFLIYKFLRNKNILKCTYVYVSRQYISYYIIIILSPYAVNTVFSTHVSWFIQCILFSIPKCVSSDWVIWFQDTCSVSLGQQRAPAVANLHVFDSVAVICQHPLRSVCVCVGPGTCLLHFVTFKNICNNVVTLYVMKIHAINYM